MSRNPSWRREELILALDLYMRHRGALPGKGSREVAELSHTLNRLASALGLAAGDELLKAKCDLAKEGGFIADGRPCHVRSLASA